MIIFLQVMFVSSRLVSEPRVSLSMASRRAWVWQCVDWKTSEYGINLPSMQSASGQAAKPKSGKRSQKECMICGGRSTTQCSSQECISRRTASMISGQTSCKPPYCCESCIKRVDGMKPLCKNCFAHKSLSMKLFVCKHCNIETTSWDRCSSDACSNTVCCSKCLVVSSAVNFCPACKPLRFQ